MGPSMFVDGDRVRRLSGQILRLCFNGAVDVRRRRPGVIVVAHSAPPMLQWGRRCSSTETTRIRPDMSPNLSLQWGRRCSSTETRRAGSDTASAARFNGAVDVRRRRPPRWLRALPRRPCFNGAVDVRRRRRAYRRRRHGRRAASMGSSMFVDGDWDHAGRRPWPCGSFNGAVDVRRRRRVSYDCLTRRVDMLQWGRRCSSTETLLRRFGASTMMTLQWAVDVRRRRRLVKYLRHAVANRASMGPSMFVDGDPCRGRGEPADPPASMGPSMFVDGDQPQLTSDRPGTGASMGPSMFVDGDKVDYLQALARGDASMGPSMFVDGDAC